MESLVKYLCPRQHGPL